jgi:uncharacterized membrane protein
MVSSGDAAATEFHTMTENENRTMLTAVVVIVAVFAGLLLLGGQTTGMMGGGMMMGGVVGIGALSFLVLVIWLVFSMADRPQPQRPQPPQRPFYPGPGGEYPLQVLDRKYANGEMTYEEYTTLRQEILRR